MECNEVGILELINHLTLTSYAKQGEGVGIHIFIQYIMPCVLNSINFIFTRLHGQVCTLQNTTSNIYLSPFIGILLLTS